MTKIKTKKGIQFCNRNKIGSLQNGLRVDIKEKDLRAGLQSENPMS